MTPSRRAWTLLVLLLIGPILASGPLSVVVASRLPIPPLPGNPLTQQADPSAPRASVRDLPAGLSADESREPNTILRAAAADALGPAAARSLVAHLESGPTVNYGYEQEPDYQGPYPGQYGWIERLLDRAPRRARSTDSARLAAVLIALDTAVSKGASTKVGYPDAAPVAYALLRRSREVAGCDAELNLLLLLSADDKPHDDLVADQGGRAVEACPSDVTPLWLLGQFQSHRAVVAGLADLTSMEANVPDDRVQRAERTADLLTTRFPGSPDAWLGLGDTHLRAGGELSPSQPFTGRQHYRSAEAAYRQAERLGGAFPAALGLARSMIGLQEPERALTVTLTEGSDTRSGPALDVLLESQEAAHDFRAATVTAKQLALLGETAYPLTGPLYPRWDPLTTGADRYVTYTVRLAPGDNAAGGGAGVADVSFIPSYRPEYGVTGSRNRCPEWSWRRDALLAGEPRSALATAPLSSSNPRGMYCVVGEVDGIAEAELRPSGQVWSDDSGQSRIEDSRQNLWRWAGDLPRAHAVVLDWDQATQHREALPALRLAEIQFLQGDYAGSAASFAIADRRSETGYTITPLTGRARLGRGTALLAGGRLSEGLAELTDLDRLASLSEVQFRRGFFVSPSDETARQYALLSYYARLQMGDAQRTSGATESALEHYAAAQELLPRLIEQQRSGRFFELGVEVVPGVLDNNQALAEMAAGRPGSAVAHAQAAMAADPADPAFALTAASAAQQSGDLVGAQRLDETTLELDPTAYPAANNLAVGLAAADRAAEAIDVLRAAIGARPDYTLGWYNLGLLYARRGPVSLLSSQGALGRAYDLDPAIEQRPRSPQYDDHVYETGLDLSKPLPTRWGLAHADRRQPLVAVGVLSILGAVIAIIRATAGGKNTWVTNLVAAARTGAHRLRWLQHRRHSGWALVGTGVAFALPLLWSRSAGAGVTAALAYLLAVECLAVAVMVTRRITAEALHVSIIQRAWPPGLVLGVITGVAGLPWAPLPYVRARGRRPIIHLIGATLLVLTAAALLLEAVIWEVPLTRSVAVAALTMAVSILMPVRPLDGAGVGKPGVVVGVGVLVIAGLAVLGVL